MRRNVFAAGAPPTPGPLGELRKRFPRLEICTGAVTGIIVPQVCVGVETEIKNPAVTTVTGMIFAVIPPGRDGAQTV